MTDVNRDLIVDDLRGVDFEISRHVENARKLIELEHEYTRVCNRMLTRIVNGQRTMLDHVRESARFDYDSEDDFQTVFTCISHAIERWAQAKSAKNDAPSAKRSKSDEYAAAVAIDRVIHIFSKIERAIPFDEYSNNMCDDSIVLSSMCLRLLNTIPASDEVAREAIDRLMASTRVNLRRSGCGIARNVDSDKFMRIFWPYVADRWIVFDDTDVHSSLVKVDNDDAGH